MREAKSTPRVSWLPLLVSIVVLVAVVAFMANHLGDASRFARLLEQARPRWVILALALQAATYICAGYIWQALLRAGGHQLRVVQLARLAIEKLSVDQIMPSGGLSGNLVVTAAMRRLGVPSALAVEALIINIFAYYSAYALAAMIVFVILWIQHDVTWFLSSLMAVFSLVIAVVLGGLIWLVHHREWRPGPRLARLKSLQRVQATIASVSPDRIRDPHRLGIAALLNLTIFFLDAATLWTLLLAVGNAVPPTTAFAALVVGSMAGTLSFLPGGIGSFEAGSTLALGLLGVPVEAALTTTLLLRGLTLWLPLIPGGLLARRDLAALRRRADHDIQAQPSPARGALVSTPEFADRRD